MPRNGSAQAAPAALLLQFARYDRFIIDEQANRYANAADREDWLAQELSLTGK